MWLEAHGFVIEQLYGDRAGNPYTETSKRAIFWARLACQELSWLAAKTHFQVAGD